MGFGGSVQAMITSLKNNAHKRKTLYDNKYYFDGKPGKTKLPKKKTHPERLKAFQLKMARERRKQQKRTYLSYAIVLIFMTALVLGLSFYF